MVLSAIHTAAALLYGAAAVLFGLTEADATVLAAAMITSIGGVTASVVAAILTARLNERLSRLEKITTSPRRIGAQAGEDGDVVVQPPDVRE